MIKTHHTAGYLQIPTSIITDRSLSLDQKGLYGIIAYYEQLPGFTLSRCYISRRHSIGTYTLKSCMKVLQEKELASCIRKNKNWEYRTCCRKENYTLIPKTVLSADISLREIGLYMIIAYAITLPDAQIGLALYKSYCTDCRKVMLSTSKLLQKSGLYIIKKITTCNYDYTLFYPNKNGDLQLWKTHSTLHSSSSTDESIVPEDKSFTHETNALPDIPFHDTPVIEGTEITAKELIDYEHETNSDPFYDPDDFESCCRMETKKIAYDLLLSSITYAATHKNITYGDGNIKFEKFFSDYVSQLGHRNIRELIIARIIDSINTDTVIHNINLYICGLIYRALPVIRLGLARHKVNAYRCLESQNDIISYTYTHGTFLRSPGTLCA